jgi:hypothetical protein
MGGGEVSISSLTFCLPNPLRDFDRVSYRKAYDISCRNNSFWVSTSSLSKSRSLFNKVTRLRARRLVNWSYISRGNKSLSVLHRIQTSFWTHPTSYLFGTGESFSQAMGPGHDVNNCRRQALYLHKRTNTHSGNPLHFIKSGSHKTHLKLSYVSKSEFC